MIKTIYIGEAFGTRRERVTHTIPLLHYETPTRRKASKEGKRRPKELPLREGKVHGTMVKFKKNTKGLFAGGRCPKGKITSLDLVLLAYRESHTQGEREIGGERVGGGGGKGRVGREGGVIMTAEVKLALPGKIFLTPPRKKLAIEKGLGELSPFPSPRGKGRDQMRGKP